MKHYEDTAMLPRMPRLVSPADGMESQPSLFRQRINTVFDQLQPQGADIAFYCSTEDGTRYYAKKDSALKPVRATEYILSSLAVHFGISVPEVAILQDELGETFFGSRDVFSTASIMDAKSLLLIPTIENAAQCSWIGQFNSAVHALDMFFSNDDRGMYNFLLTQDGLRKILYAIDFANADLVITQSDTFLLPTSNTSRHKKIVERLHGFDVAVAKNLVENLGQLDQSFIQRTVDQMPDDWLDSGTRKSFCDMWSNGIAKHRSEALKSLFDNGKAI